MADLLRALGWKVGLRSVIRLVALVATTTLLVLAGGLALAEALAIPVPLVQIAIWAGWLVWLASIFPRNARADAETPCALPYRRAFFREILLGISVAFSQILRPVVSGVVEAGLGPTEWTTIAAVGILLAGAGVAVIGLGVAALGVARTLFVYEYVPKNGDVTATGIYRFLRHPLFLGGSVLSLGLAICTGATVAIGLGLLNLCVVPIYVQLEDRRCCKTLGGPYVRYRDTVGGVIPRRRSVISSSALSRQVSGSIGPMTERNFVKTP
jgi:protein-S-isoprenylcysteine O-methyltransferase Ste14